MAVSKVVSIDAGAHRADLLARRDALVEAHLDMVPPIARSVLRHLPRTFDLDDLIATGYLGLLKAATNYRPEAHPDTVFAAYARPVVRGAILDSIRRSHYVENTRPSCEDMAHPAYVPQFEAALDQAQRLGQVRAAIGELRPRLKRVVGLHYGRELRIHEVSSELGCCRSRASQLHLEAVRHLRERLLPEAASE